MKTGRTMVASAAGKGISLVLKRWECGRDSGASRCGPAVMPGLQGKGPCGKGSIFAVLIFLLLFLSRKKVIGVMAMKN
ncbi:MAG: hypothetical protein V4592_04040 [Bacteroidota bacterium]